MINFYLLREKLQNPLWFPTFSATKNYICRPFSAYAKGLRRMKPAYAKGFGG
jgi:hypothetical protein